MSREECPSMAWRCNKFIPAFTERVANVLLKAWGVMCNPVLLLNRLNIDRRPSGFNLCPSYVWNNGVSSVWITVLRYANKVLRVLIPMTTLLPFLPFPFSTFTTPFDKSISFQLSEHTSLLLNPQSTINRIRVLSLIVLQALITSLNSLSVRIGNCFLLIDGMLKLRASLIYFSTRRNRWKFWLLLHDRESCYLLILYWQVVIGTSEYAWLLTVSVKIARPFHEFSSCEFVKL